MPFPARQVSLQPLDDGRSIDFLPLLPLLLANGFIVTRAGLMGRETKLPVYILVGYSDELDLLHKHEFTCGSRLSL